MSISDLKHSLRKCEFPVCAKEALIRIEQLLAGRVAPTSKQMDIAMDIISEFIFCESEWRGGRRGSTLNSLQELQLIDIICDHISACTNETTKNTIFLSLFGGTENPKRLKILSILASMAVSASSTPVLLGVGVWLQQMGCSSAQSLQLVENIIRDHFYLNKSNQIALRSLAGTAPQFLANFITAVTELYMNNVQGPTKIPPKNLLETITSWVYSNPTLCSCAQQSPAALPVGAIPMAAVTPLAGLVRWCALAPLHLPHDTTEETPPVAKKIKLEEVIEKSGVKSLSSRELSESELYMKLQVGVLQSMRAARGGALAAQSLASLVPAMRARPRRAEDPALQECLDRLGQAVQVGLASGCVFGNVGGLVAALSALPPSRLLRRVMRDQGAAPTDRAAPFYV